MAEPGAGQAAAMRTSRRLLAVVPAALALTCFAACGDDDGPPEPPSSGSVMPGATDEVLDSTGGPGGTVLNNQPTNPETNNAPPGDDGTG